MCRWFYLGVLRLHPRAFRERFAEEMIGIFDQEERKGALLLDGVVSLFRQRAFRPARRELAFAAVGPVTPSNIPAFHTFEDYLPRRSAIVHGAILTLLLFGAMSLMIGRGGGRRPWLLMGARYPRPNVLPVDRSSIREGEPTTAVHVESPPVDPLYQLADAYFRAIRLLGALDADGDRVISAWEIITATSPLARLDRDHDGKLSPEECGFSLGNNPNSRLDPAHAERARLDFMRMNPVLAALDADHDGNISAAEIKSSPAALRTLDQNRDGSLTPAEVLPEVIDHRAALIFAKLDKNRDGRISVRERATKDAQPLRDLFERAERDGDGVITAAEVTRALQFRDELTRQRERAVRSGGAGDRGHVKLP